MSLQLQYLREKIETANTLLGVVETMHGLAAVNIRRAESAAVESARYARTVHLALHAALHHLHREAFRPEASQREASQQDADISRAKRPTLLIISTDMGLCGQFNERVVNYGLDLESRLGARVRWIVVGLRGLERLEEVGADVVSQLDAPGSVEAIPNTVARVFSMLNAPFKSSEPPGPGPFYIVHNRPDGGAAFTGRHVRLFPFEPDRWRQWPEDESPWQAEPMTSPTAQELLPHLIQEQMYIDVFQAFLESFAAENAARLASMKNATDNIDELLDELQARYRRERQDAITTELMELLSGVEAVLEAP